MPPTLAATTFSWYEKSERDESSTPLPLKAAAAPAEVGTPRGCARSLAASYSACVRGGAVPFGLRRSSSASYWTRRYCSVMSRALAASLSRAESSGNSRSSERNGNAAIAESSQYVSQRVVKSSGWRSRLRSPK